MVAFYLLIPFNMARKLDQYNTTSFLPHSHNFIESCVQYAHSAETIVWIEKHKVAFGKTISHRLKPVISTSPNFDLTLIKLNPIRPKSQFFESSYRALWEILECFPHFFIKSFPLRLIAKFAVPSIVTVIVSLNKIPTYAKFSVSSSKGTQ